MPQDGSMKLLLGGNESGSRIERFMKEDTGKILSRLEKDYELISYPQITSVVKANTVSKDMLSKDIDCLLLVFIVWSEDEYSLPFKDLMKIRPSILWAYTPYTEAPGKKRHNDTF